MELLWLRYFQTVAQMESITKAANHYYIPQPAMSQTIARLERELGNIKLFDRINNRLYLNDDGRIFLEYVDRALMEIDNGVAAIAVRKEEVRGPVHILLMENRRFVLSCVSKFANWYPDVNFSISHDFYSDQPQEYDLCVSSSGSYHQMRSCEPFVKERIVLAVHEDHPLAGLVSVNLSQLKDEKFITMSSRFSLYSITYDNCRSCGFEPHVPFICDDPYFVRKYISERMGIALAPAISWEGRFRSNTVLIPIEDPPIYTTSYLAWDERRSLSAAVRRFRDFLLQEALALPGNLVRKEIDGGATAV